MVILGREKEEMFRKGNTDTLLHPCSSVSVSAYNVGATDLSLMLGSARKGESSVCFIIPLVLVAVRASYTINAYRYLWCGALL